MAKQNKLNTALSLAITTEDRLDAIRSAKAVRGPLRTTQERRAPVATNSIAPKSEDSSTERSPKMLREQVQQALRRQLETLTENEGLPSLEIRGNLLRPMLACGSFNAHGTGISADAFWTAALAVQMAHEASLLHDDILDSAETRRGTPSLSAQSGDARALVEGDHLLTAAYRVVMHTRCWDLIDLFTRVGERTVAGEKLQGASNGKILDWDTYLKILSGKTGELFGFALAIGPALVGDSRRYDYYLLGRRLGAFYQMYDDLLDYCSHANTGKPPFQDYRGKTWSWPMLALEEPSFDLPEDQLRDQLFRERTVSGRSGIREALQVFQREYTELREQLVTLLGPRNSVIDMLDDLWTKSEDAIRREEFLLKR